jgi:hypothetical protein
LIKNCIQNVSDEGLASLASNSQLLKHLNISNCNHLTDLTLQSLGAKCSDLKIFECAGCFNFSDNGFLALTKVNILFYFIIHLSIKQLI